MEAYIKPKQNSTRHWKRDLKACEVDLIKWASGNTGSCGDKAGSHRLSSGQRAQNMKKLKEKIRKGLSSLGKISSDESLEDAAIRMGFSQAVKHVGDATAPEDEDLHEDGEYEVEMRVVATV